MFILLTGSSGFLGKIVYKTLVKVTNIETLGRYDSNYKLDITNTIPKLLNQYDLVVHAAGKAHQTPKKEEDAKEFYKVNVQGTFNLLKALELSHPPKSFIFISTVAVYGRNKGNLIAEDEPLLAKDPYGHSKIQAEQLVLKWCEKHKVVCTILRLPLIAGPNPPGNLGAMIKGIKKGYYFNVDGGKQRKSMVLAEDIANYILKVGKIGGIFNLTDGYHPNFNELSQLVAEQSSKSNVLNMPLILAYIAAKIGDAFGKYAPLNTEKLDKLTSTLTFDDSKARAAFGWNPTPVLEGFKIN